MLANVRALEGFILIKNTHAPDSCISLVSVIKTLGLGLMVADWTPPGPSRTCSTEKSHIIKLKTKQHAKAKESQKNWLLLTEDTWTCDKQVSKVPASGMLSTSWK